MGKVGAEEEQALPTNDDTLVPNEERASFGWCGCGLKRIYGLTGLRCVLVLVLSVAVFLSAVFWLPPFLQFADQGDPDLESRFKDHDIVASFNVKKSVSSLEDYILQLEEDIFDEIGTLSSKVVIISLEASAGSNITKVVFGVDPDAKSSKLPSTALSLIRASLESLVVNESSLRLTKSLFGEPLSFEVLKFPGGITIIPRQSAFLLQKVQIPFNFTLNFSICQIQEYFAELASQLRAGLHLMPYENLYIRLSNFKGSTVAPPTTVQSYVLLAIGNSPSMPRLKQLAQTIKGHTRNLGLNNSVFGRVKQVSLSSILQHSLHGSEASATSPSPASLPHPHRHHHHHHHHHHHPHNSHLAPAISPAPATERGAPMPVDSSHAPLKSSPAPYNGNRAKPPCGHGHKMTVTGHGRKQSHLAPTVAPPHFSSLPMRPHIGSPTATPMSHTIPSSSPLPNVVFAHVQPPSMSESYEEHPHTLPSISPSPLSSSAGLHTVRWTLSLSLFLVWHL